MPTILFILETLQTFSSIKDTFNFFLQNPKSKIAKIFDYTLEIASIEIATIAHKKLIKKEITMQFSLHFAAFPRAKFEGKLKVVARRDFQTSFSLKATLLNPFERLESNGKQTILLN